MDEKHTVSALKFRPRTFSEVVGQPHIVRTLTNAISKKRIAHAYLFSGIRGVGKTTMARILAKALNCENGPTPEPCLECANCREIAAGTSMDVFEIDGASNRGIDNIRDLREKVNYAPVRSRHKIYIIDEVHQITKDAFNALLKTLEEPPKHVVFIFATTELSKVPDTILSRCQSFEYKTISSRDIVAQLDMIAKREGIEASPAAVETIARRARGSMRDAQSLFDQAAAYGAGQVTEEDVTLILGMAPRTALFGVITAALSGDRAAILGIAEDVASSGADPVLFIEDLMEMMGEIMTARVRPGITPGAEMDENEKLASFAEDMGFDEIQRFFSVLVETADQMRRSHQPSLNMEMGLLRLAERRGGVSLDDLLDSVAAAEARLDRDIPAASNPYPVKKNNPAPADDPPREMSIPGITPAVMAEVEPAEEDISRRFEGDDGGFGLRESFKREIKGPVLNGIFDSAAISAHDGTVAVTVGSLFERESLDDPAVKAKLEAAASRVLGLRARVVIMFQDEKRDDDGLRKKMREQENSLRKQITETPIVQDALDLFNGEIVEVKVKKEG